MSATTSLPEDNPVVTEWVPAREPVIESVDALFCIPTLVSTSTADAYHTMYLVSID